MTQGAVSFSPSEFTDMYPAFVKVPDAALIANFELATLALNNSVASIVRNVGTRQSLLYLATAHYTALLNGVNGDPPNPTLVGRITSANQGSVSVSTEFKSDSESAAFWNTTTWGASFWQLTARFRTSRYLGSPFNGGWGRGDWGGGWPL